VREKGKLRTKDVKIEKISSFVSRNTGRHRTEQRYATDIKRMIQRIDFIYTFNGYGSFRVGSEDIKHTTVDGPELDLTNDFEVIGLAKFTLQKGFRGLQGPEVACHGWLPVDQRAMMIAYVYQEVEAGPLVAFSFGMRHFCDASVQTKI
jgi:hypothetical protein